MRLSAPLVGPRLHPGRALADCSFLGSDGLGSLGADLAARAAVH